MAQFGGRSKSSLSYLDRHPAGKEPLHPLKTSSSLKGGRSSASGRWPMMSSGSFNDNDGHKKSMLLKVKEKAKKWKQVLGKKKHGRQDGSSHRRESSIAVASSEINRGGEDEEIDGGEDDKAPSPRPHPSNMAAGAEHGETSGKDSTMKSSGPLGDASKQPETTTLMTEAAAAAAAVVEPPAEVNKQSPAPEMVNRPPHDSVKEITIQEIPAAAADITGISNNNSVPIDAPHGNNDSKNNENDDDNKKNDDSSSIVLSSNEIATTNDDDDDDSSIRSSSSRSLLAPAYSMTHAIASRIQETSGPMYEIAAKQVWEKSLSMKEYLLHKLEPREEDRALCKVITDVVTPRIVGLSSSSSPKAAAPLNAMNNDSLKATPPAISAKPDSETLIN